MSKARYIINTLFNLNESNMIKSIHIIFIFISFASFFSRFALSIFKPELLQKKIIKIAPHIIDTLLLISGVTLVFQGNWLAGDFGWILSKIILLISYILLAVMAMRLKGSKRWFAFAAAVACYVYIFIIAISKHGFI